MQGRQTDLNATMSFVLFIIQFGFWSDSCHRCGFNYFENNKVCTWKILPFAVKSYLLFLGPFFVHRFRLCRRELWGKHFNPLLSCCNLFRITGMLMQRLQWDNEVPLDMPGEVTEKECEAVTSRCMLD